MELKQLAHVLLSGGATHSTVTAAATYHLVQAVCSCSIAQYVQRHLEFEEASNAAPEDLTEV